MTSFPARFFGDRRSRPVWFDGKTEGVKKILAAAFAGFILFLALGGALSIVPHAHGDDSHHSSHGVCAFHPLSHHGFQAIVGAGFSLVCSVSALFLFLEIRLGIAAVLIRVWSVRAPPSLF